MTIRKGTITIGTTKINWKQDANGIKYSDGRILQDTSFDTTDAKLAYKYAEAIKEPRVISWNDFKQLKDIQDQDFALIPGDYRNQGQARIENFSRVSVSFAKSQFGEKNGVTIEMIGQHNDVLFDGGTNTNESQRFIQYKTGNALVSKNITIQNVVSDNGGSWFGNDGNLDPVKGLINPIQGLVIKNNLGKNCPSVREMVYAYAVEDVDIHDNYMTNINHALMDDLGLIVILGNGKVHSNRAFDYNGHMTRTQPMQILGDGKKLELFNNFGMITDKYGLFDAQVMDYYSKNKLFKPADINVYNNTGGKLGQATWNDWDAMMFVAYQFYSKLGYWNNVGFEMKKMKDNKPQGTGITDMINYNSTPVFSRFENNKYFDTIEQAMAFQKANPGIGSDLVL